MNDKQFKILSFLLAAIFILLFIIFFGHIFAFISSILIGAIGLIALSGLMISTLKPIDFIAFGVLVFFSGIAYFLMKYEVKKEQKKQAKINEIIRFLNNEFQIAIDNINNEETIKDPSKTIEILKRTSNLDSSDRRIAYSFCALGKIHSTNTYGVYDIQKAINFYTAAANKGNKYAEITLGKIYFEGNKVKTNYEMAWQYFYNVRKLYPSEANLYLGLILRKCHKTFFGVDSTISPNSSDYKLAFELISKAAKSENPLPLASFKLGAMTYLGQGTEKNYDLAFSLMYSSVTTCLDAELIYLAEMYNSGLGVEKNYGRALYFAIMANYHGSECQEFIEAITENTSDSDKAEAYYDIFYSTSDNDKFNHEYLNKSELLGNKSATIQKAYYHIHGTNQYYEINKVKAYELLLPLALSGNVNAQYMISDLLIKGEGIEQDRNKGFDFLKLAAEQGHSSANGLLAYYLQEENNDNINERIFNLYLKAAKLGNAYSCYVVGDIYLNGIRIDGNYEEVEFVKKDIALGIQYLEDGATNGNDDCQFLLGTVYYYGLDSIPHDYEKSYTYFRKCVSSGDNFAKKYLGLLYDFGFGVDMNSYLANSYYIDFLKEFEDGLVHHNIASNYMHDKGTNVNVPEAIKHYEIAAHLGFTHSTMALAFMYLEGKHKVKDLIKSLTWFFVSAELNQNDAFEQIKLIKEQISSEGIDKAKADAEIILSKIKK